MVVVGSSIVKGEDIVPKGFIRVFEVIDVVPEPDQPEKNKKLKLFAKEEVKGAVTALSGIGGQGFLIVAQGQKCMVRGLKEDGSLLPVAFKDTQCYVNVLKELKGTGMCIIGDAFKGLWFIGYSVSIFFHNTSLKWILLFTKASRTNRRNHINWIFSVKRMKTWRSWMQTSFQTGINYTS